MLLRTIKRKINYFLRVIHTFRGLSVAKWYIIVHFCNTSNKSRIVKLHLRNYVTDYLYVRSNSSDIWLTANILVGRIGEANGYCGDYDTVIELARVHDVFNGKRTIIDAGANIGLFALQVKNQYPDAEVILIEPDDNNYEILKMNISKLSGIHMYKAGIWYKQTYLCIINPKANDWSKRVAETSKGHGIPAITIKEIMNENNINEISLLKMDIEGSEYYVFKYGDKKWIQSVKALVIETHDKYVEGSDVLINSTMDSLNYTKYVVGENQCFFRS